MQRALYATLLLAVMAFVSSCSSSLHTQQQAGGADDYAALEQPVPEMTPEVDEDATAAISPEKETKTLKRWGKKAKGLFAGIAIKKAAKKLVPKSNMAKDKGQKVTLLEVLLLLILVLVVIWLLQVVLEVEILATLISVAVLVLLILLILYLLGEL